MRGWLAAAACALAFAAAPAHAADEKTLACLTENLSAPGRASVAAWGTTVIEAEPGKLPGMETVADAVSPTVALCAGKYGWSEDAKTVARVILTVTVGMSGAEAALKARNIDTAGIQRIYREFPAELRATPMTSWPKQTYYDVAKTGTESGYFQSDQARIVGRYLGMLSLLDVSRIAFAKA